MASNEIRKVTEDNVDQCSKMSITDIEPGISLQDKVIQGTVFRRWPMQSRKGRKLVKIILKEGNTSIPVYFLDDYANPIDSVNIGDKLYLANALIENNTGLTEDHTCQLMMDPAMTKAIIKVERQKSTTFVSSFDNMEISTTSKGGMKSQQTGSEGTSCPGKNYSYTKLNNIKVKTTVNVYGVVKFFKPPYKSRGTDYMMILSLIDPSYSDENDKLKCILFNKDIHQFPAVEKVGDIVRFHRLQVTEYKLQPQGNGGPGFAWLVFNGGLSDSEEPRAASSLHYFFSDVDRQQVMSLRNWRHEQLDLSQEESQRISTLSSITCNKYFDAVCQVIGTCLLKPSSLLLRVWDGTKIHLPVVKEEKENNSEDMNVNEDLVKCAKDYIYDVKVFDDHVEKALTVKPGDFIQLRNLHAAKYKVQDGMEENALPTIELCLHQGKSYNRGLDVLPMDHLDVKQLQLILTEIPIPLVQESISTSKATAAKTGSKSPSVDTSVNDVIPVKRTRENPQNPGTNSPPCSGTSSGRCMQTSATIITDHHHIKTCCIHSVNRGKVPNMYRVRAKVIDLQPKTDHVNEFLKLYCSTCHYVNTVQGMNSMDPVRVINSVKYYSCPQCKKTTQKNKNNVIIETGSRQLEYIYMLQFIIKDSTGWVLAQLWKEEAVKFFDNREPRTLLKDRFAFNHIQNCLKNFLGYSIGDNLLWKECNIDKVQTKPWVECCIKSYNTEHGVCYQIFDTVVCEEDSCPV